jgi:glutaredoxin
VEYIDVAGDKSSLEAMMAWSGGSRRIPVIVVNGKAAVGFNGRS